MDEREDRSRAIHIIVMSDLHLSRKPWLVRKALKMGQDADAVLLAGDLVNDGKPQQLERMRLCIEELLPDTPVLAVTGNHDYPYYPSPMIRDGICDYPALQEWLLKRQKYLHEQDISGAWAVCVDTDAEHTDGGKNPDRPLIETVGKTEIIGLNCVSNWRRFKFQDAAQLKWLEQHLAESNAKRYIILCHAPLLMHNPMRSDSKPYLSRDEELQRIVNNHRNIIFISGHTHVSMESAVSCVDYDAERNNLYINDGSIRPTTVLNADGHPVQEPAVGNVVELGLSMERVSVTVYSVDDGTVLAREVFRD